jgi:periplasmic divalent cation tolerance protein
MSNEPEFVFVYTTMPDPDAARALGLSLVHERLAACVNVHAPMSSVYRWEGKVEIAPEVPVFIKTRAALVEDVIAFARKKHPYTVPCFLVLPIVSGNDDYLAWARNETQRGKAKL